MLSAVASFDRELLPVPDETLPTPQTAASAARRATDDPHLFLIPETALPPGFAERVETGGWTPAEARPAATVLLVRDGAGGPEALLLRRHRRSGFAAGAWVFPGGVVDEADRDGALLERLDGPTPGQWAERLEVGDAGEALGYVAAAVREAFEETGILLARPDPDLPQPADVGEGLDVARRALLNGVAGLRETAVTLGLRLAADRLVYIAHWITPAPEPRRYDTRFFLAQVDADALCTVHEAELTEARWMTPAAAVAAFEAGDIQLLPPTVATLRRLAEFDSVEGARRALADAPVPAILPRMRRHPDGVVIEIPEGA